MENNFTLTTIESQVFEVTTPENAQPVRHSTTAETTKLFNAVSGSAEPVADYIGETIECTDIVITGANVHTDRDDDESPFENRPCVHFFTTDGKHISTLSNGICRTVNNLLSCGIIPAQESPLKIRFKEIKTKRGTAHVFELA